MRFIIGLIIFWLCTFGIKKYLEDKFKIEKHFTLPLTFSFIGIVMFMSGILNMMPLATILIVLFGCGYLGYTLYKEKNTKKILNDIKNPTFILLAIVFAYITIVGIGMHLTHYDNFSHWGLIIKNMFIDNALPNFENTTILFKGYQPGSACFIYFFGLLCGNSEGCMIVAQNYLIFGFLTTLFGFIKENNQWLKRILLVVFYIFIMLISIKFSDLLVDSLIATMTICSLSLIYHYRNDLKKTVLYSLPISIFLLLVKNTGLILAGLNCLYIIYIAYKNKELKQGIKYVVITGLTLLAVLLIWQSHVKLVYGELALNAKHSLSTENIILSLRTKGWSNIFSFIKNYIFHLFSLKNNKPNIYMLIINIVLLVFAFTQRNEKKEKRIPMLLIGTINLIYLGYYGILGVMYLLSMPWEEAIQFAGYERYMSTILIIIIGITFIYLLKYKEKNHNFKVISVIIILLQLSTIYTYQSNAIALLGEDYYKYSSVEKYDKIIDQIPIEETKKYYIYSPSSENPYGYIYYLSLYKLNKKNIEVINDIDNIKEDMTGILILIEEDENITEKIIAKGWQAENLAVYTK